MLWLLSVMTALSYVATLGACRYYVHMMQLESYQPDGYMRFLKKDRSRVYGWTLRSGAISCALALALPVFTPLFTGERTYGTLVANVLACAFFGAYSAYYIYSDIKTRQKKPLKFTKRAIRLSATVALVAAIALALIFFIFRWKNAYDSGYTLQWLPPFSIIVASPYIVYLAALIVNPIEARVNHKFFVMAQKALEARPDLIKIGITGSFGKTTVKFCLKTILSEKYNVLASESSFNTPMGLSRTINEKLKPEHQVFIAEMGARHKGDIKELCDLVHPKYGVLTAVGAQHLETFKDVKTVAKTKYELIEGLPADGVAFFAADGGYSDKLYERCQIQKRRAGMGEGYLHMYAEKIETGVFGSRFTLTDGMGESVKCETKLLGSHNISNIALCCAVARELGMSMADIAKGVSNIKPVEHRLQLISGRLNVIDDAFNSNPAGAKEALNVLKGFPGKKLVVTPGFVELGDDEDDFHFRLGAQIADACDFCILIGEKRTQKIREGLAQSGFSGDNVLTAASLEEASAHIPDFVSTGDVVLFENDLPDNYTE